MCRLQALCANGFVRWTNHIVTRLVQRGIRTEEVLRAIMEGEIIEEYPRDFPFPSCLLLHTAKDNQPLHVVCGISDTELWLITAYVPNDTEWNSGFRQRKVIET